MKASSLRIVAAWLQGHADAGIDLNGGIELPLFIRPQLSALLQSAVLADENSPAGADLFERGGVWHRAVNRVMDALSAECKAMTAHYEYPHGLGLADGAFKSFMAAIPAMGIEMPTDVALAAADGERQAKAEANRAEALAAQEQQRAQASGGWDDSEAYSYH